MDIAAELRRLADKIDDSKPTCVKCGDQPFGTSHWAGTYRGLPAITLSYYGGAVLFVFCEGMWVKLCGFSSLAECHERLGIDS